MKAIFGLVGILLVGVVLADDPPADPAAAPPAAPAAAAPGPMFATHDYASGAMQERMKIENGEKCDIDFGSKLEVIVNEMEQNKEASEEVSNKLRNQFKETMEGHADKKLCLKDSWCDAGICKVRGASKSAKKGRGMQKGRAAEADAAGNATTPATAGSSGSPVNGSDTTSKAPETSGAAVVAGSLSCVLYTLSTLVK